ncbi:MAG: hypothetical protein U5L96_06525 [Owenweeksia sp.]|nr:hypothetical protein [Owenweeksia sp.]
MRDYCYYLFSLLLFLPVLSEAQDITLARFPAISPDGSHIAFCYQGDIWVQDLQADFPRRLTIHEAYESNPTFSPDGQLIAFTSNRFGNKDVFTTSISGGVPKRITYHSTSDELSDWTTDNKLLFGTRRAYAQVEWDGEIYSAPVAGGTPQRVLGAVGEMATTSADGRYVAFVRGACRASRESYQGPADLEVWLYDVKKETYTAVTDNESNDLMPHWGEAGELFFLSSINGRYNIVKVDATDESFQRSVITTYQQDGIRHFDVAGDQLVYERGTGIYLKKGATEAQKLNLNIHPDYRFDPTETKTFTSNIEEYELSLNGKYAATVIRGEGVCAGIRYGGKAHG